VKKFIHRPDSNRYNPVIFPHAENYNWTLDNFGPLQIPKKGNTINLTVENLPLYLRVISTYEGHTVEVKNEVIYIDGKQTTSYTFGMDYYFMMGDNRHMSLDSRYWGFVPEDHVVGKASMIWMSSGEEGIRWKRIFKLI
jgi:signal peptidase I